MLLKQMQPLEFRDGEICFAINQIRGKIHSWICIFQNKTACFLTQEFMKQFSVFVSYLIQNRSMGTTSHNAHIDKTISTQDLLKLTAVAFEVSNSPVSVFFKIKPLISYYRSL